MERYRQYGWLPHRHQRPGREQLDHRHGQSDCLQRGAVGFVAINNDTSAWTKTFQTGLPAGTYCNVVHGLVSGTSCASDSVTVDSSGNATITLPANGGSTVPAVAIYTGQKLGSSTSTGSGTCTVTFSIANANTTYGQNLYVVGNQTALGSWTPASGYALTIQGSGANATWSGSVSLPASTAVQYKYIKWDGSTATWKAINPPPAAIVNSDVQLGHSDPGGRQFQILM